MKLKTLKDIFFPSIKSEADVLPAIRKNVWGCYFHVVVSLLFALLFWFTPESYIDESLVDDRRLWATVLLAAEPLILLYLNVRVHKKKHARISAMIILVVASQGIFKGIFDGRIGVIWGLIYFFVILAMLNCVRATGYAYDKSRKAKKAEKIAKNLEKQKLKEERKA